MPTFAYSARDESGRLVKGVLDAESQMVVADRLRKMGYLVTRMEVATSAFPGLQNFSLGRVPPEDLLLSAVQLANMVEAGVPLMSSIQSVASQTSCRSLRAGLEAVARDIQGGGTFSSSLGRYPAVFPKQMVSMAAVGEASGKLDLVLTRFANFLEKDLALSRAVSGALMYPLLLLGAATVLIVFVVSFVIPQFAALFMKMGISLPLPTRILVMIGEAIRTRWWAILLLGAGGCVALTALAQLPPIRLRIDRMLLKFPVEGLVVH